MLVESSSACVECSYDLQGLHIDGVCPECGVPVERSLRGFLLQYAGDTYLRTLESGLSLVLRGIWAYLLVILAITVWRAAGRSWGVTVQGADLIRAMAGLVITSVILLGYFRYSAPDPGFAGKDKGDSARTSLRSVVILQVCIAIIDFGVRVAQSGGVTFTGAGALLIPLASTLSILLWALQLSTVMSYTAWLARRIPDPFVVKRASAFRWQFPLLTVLCLIGGSFSGCALIFFVLAGLAMLIRYWTLLNRMRTHMRSIIRSGRPAEVNGEHVGEPAAESA